MFNHKVNEWINYESDSLTEFKTVVLSIKSLILKQIMLFKIVV